MTPARFGIGIDDLTGSQIQMIIQAVKEQHAQEVAALEQQVITLRNEIDDHQIILDYMSEAERHHNLNVIKLHKYAEELEVQFYTPTYGYTRNRHDAARMRSDRNMDWLFLFNFVCYMENRMNPNQPIHRFENTPPGRLRDTWT